MLNLKFNDKNNIQYIFFFAAMKMMFFEGKKRMRGSRIKIYLSLF
jgi:hypothetical protein